MTRDAVVRGEIERLRRHILGAVPSYLASKDPARRELAAKLQVAAQEISKGNFHQAAEPVNDWIGKVCQVKLTLMCADQPNPEMVKTVGDEIGQLMFWLWCLFQI